MIRIFDFLFSFLGLILAFPLMLLIVLISIMDTGSPIFMQERVGRNKKPFILVKFRTMKKDTPSVASHLVDVEKVTGFGQLLRSTKLDELPQLWNVLKGEMSLVGPRPCLFNQDEVVSAREALGVYSVRPGITGLAQINKVDMSNPGRLAVIDSKMIDTMSMYNYFLYILLTFTGKGSGDRIRNP